jgi:hypothetical protein
LTDTFLRFRDFSPPGFEVTRVSVSAKEPVSGLAVVAFNGSAEAAEYPASLNLCELHVPE